MIISAIISFILVIVGAINWLSIGFFQYDVVAGIFGTQANIFSRLVYILVGLAAIWLTYCVIRYNAKLTLLDRESVVNERKDRVAHNTVKYSHSAEAGKDYDRKNSKTNNDTLNTNRSSNFNEYEYHKKLDFEDDDFLD